MAHPSRPEIVHHSESDPTPLRPLHDRYDDPFTSQIRGSIPSYEAVQQSLLDKSMQCLGIMRGSNSRCPKNITCNMSHPSCLPKEFRIPSRSSRLSGSSESYHVFSCRLPSKFTISNCNKTCGSLLYKLGSVDTVLTWVRIG